MHPISIKSLVLAGTSFMILATSGCKKDNQFGTLSIEFEHVWNSTDFAFGQALVHPITNDTTTFSTLRYYVSNIKLKDEDGNEWVQPESYYLIDEAGTKTIEIAEVPAGKYTEISYTLGVDSLRNVSGAQDGALSTTNGMFWSWNSGYIFLKAEGTSPNSMDGSFAYHIGGFSGSQNAIRTTVQSLGSEPMAIKNEGSREMHFLVDVAALWTSTFRVSSNNMVHMPGASAVTVATNWQSGFSLDHIH